MWEITERIISSNAKFIVKNQRISSEAKFNTKKNAEIVPRLSIENYRDSSKAKYNPK